MKQHHPTPKAARPAPPPAAADKAAATVPVEQKDEFVRQAAYCYYEARGRVGGQELDDWLKAETEFERLCHPDSQDAPAPGH
jgi:hypothetical protein